MSVFEWLLEVVLLGSLGVTAFYAVRLERALRVLRGDRAAVGELVAGFDSSARTAGQGLERVREAAETAGRDMARHLERATALKDDLGYLTERGNRLADRMDALVRAGRTPGDGPAFPQPDAAYSAEPEPAIERRRPSGSRHAESARNPAPPDAPGPLRSQAERDLLKALGVVR